jgi:hypothetical protein
MQGTVAARTRSRDHRVQISRVGQNDPLIARDSDTHRPKPRGLPKYKAFRGRS